MLPRGPYSARVGNGFLRWELRYENLRDQPAVLPLKAVI